METDCGSWSPFYNGVLKGTPILLKLLNKYDIKASFFLTGEMAGLFPEIGKEIFANKHDIGCHSLYHETVGDPIFEIPGNKPLLEEEVYNRLKIATEIIKKNVGIAPKTFRSPRLWGSTTVVNALERLEYSADASYPLYFYEKQLQPYHPSKNNWLEKGEMKILEIPNFADLTVKSKDKYGRDRDQWPLYRTKSAGHLMKHIKNYIDFLENKNFIKVLCFYFHPWEFIEMPRRFDYGEGTVIPKYFLIKNCGKYALQEFEKLIIELLNIDSIFISSLDLASKYEW